MNRKVRVGLIGTGFMASAHSECYGMSGLAQLEVVCGRSEAKLQSFKERFHFVKGTADWRQVVEDPNVEVVDITAPNYLHKEIAVACARARKNFIIEKPLAVSVREADEIINEVDKTGVKAMYAEDLRFAPQYVEMKKVIDGGGIGKVFMIRTNELHNGPFHSKWFWDSNLAGGGVVIDVGVHGIYCAEWIMEAKVKEVFAVTGVMKWKENCKNGSEDTAMVMLAFENGAIGELVFSWAISGGMDTRFEAFGTKGSIYVDSSRAVGGLLVHSEEGYGEDLKKIASERPHAVPTRGWTFPSVDVWNVHGHAQEIRHLLSCILEDRVPTTTLEEGRRVLKIVEGIYKSAKTGGKVAI